MICASWSLFPKLRASMKFAKSVVSVTLKRKLSGFCELCILRNPSVLKKSLESKKTSLEESGVF